MQFGPFVARRICAQKQREYVLVEEILMLTQVEALVVSMEQPNRVLLLYIYNRVLLGVD